MKTFFIEQSNKADWIKRMLKKISIQDNKIIINAYLQKTKVEKKEYIVKQIKQLLIKENVKQVVIQKDLKKDKEFVNLLHGYNINICDEKWLFKQLTNEIIDDILGNKKKAEEQIHICINEIDNITEKYIYKFAKEFKNLNIITRHVGKFKKIEEKLYQDNGILINITNNKRKSLSKAKLILNIDFPKEILNQFTIYDNSTIVTWEEDIKILKKRFNGKIIKEVKYKFLEENEVTKFMKENNLEGYDERDICQALELIPKGEVL